MTRRGWRWLWGSSAASHRAKILAAGQSASSQIWTAGPAYGGGSGAGSESTQTRRKGRKGRANRPASGRPAPRRREARDTHGGVRVGRRAEVRGGTAAERLGIAGDQAERVVQHDEPDAVLAAETRRGLLVDGEDRGEGVLEGDAISHRSEVVDDHGPAPRDVEEVPPRPGGEEPARGH